MIDAIFFSFCRTRGVRVPGKSTTRKRSVNVDNTQLLHSVYTVVALFATWSCPFQLPVGGRAFPPPLCFPPSPPHIYLGFTCRSSPNQHNSTYFGHVSDVYSTMQVSSGRIWGSPPLFLAQFRRLLRRLGPRRTLDARGGVALFPTKGGLLLRFARTRQ